MELGVNFGCFLWNRWGIWVREWDSETVEVLLGLIVLMD
jgi:hypothetical protein